MLRCEPALRAERICDKLEQTIGIKDDSTLEGLINQKAAFH